MGRIWTLGGYYNFLVLLYHAISLSAPNCYHNALTMPFLSFYDTDERAVAALRQDRGLRERGPEPVPVAVRQFPGRVYAAIQLPVLLARLHQVHRPVQQGPIRVPGQHGLPGPQGHLLPAKDRGILLGACMCVCVCGCICIFDMYVYA